MSITVYEALRLPGLSSARLIAGQGGTHNLIKWVTTVEVIEDISRLQEGEFLVTTGYGLDKHSEHFQKLLAMKKLSGAAIYTGFYLKQIPQVFKDIANQNDLPLIELPTALNFSSITKSILEQILNKQMELISSSLDFHKQLTQLVVKNEGKPSISDRLSLLTGTSLFIMDESGDLSYSVQKHESISIDETELIVHQDSLPYKDLSEKCQLERKPLEMELNRFKVLFYPISANEKNYGCLIAIKKLDEWSELHISTLEHAAAVFAIEYLKEEVVLQTQNRLRGEFLEQLINKNFQTSSMALERGKKLGFDLSLSQAILYVKLLENIQDSRHFKKSMDLLKDLARTELEKLGRQFVIRERLEGLMILFEVKEGRNTNRKQDSLKTAGILYRFWKQKLPGVQFTVGVGRTYAEVSRLNQSAVEAEYAADLHTLLFMEKEIIHYDDLAAFHLLLQMKEAGLSLKQFYEEQMGSLLNKSKQGIDLIHTLEAFFKHNHHIQATASELFIHRHTLKYRLNLIEERSGYHLDSADDRLKLQLAMAAYKLEQYYQ
ncbi:PucR family transcriptional regulator [Halobacillus sp. B29]|uniref:PucR family transcriptional regulator n=1 Tax=Halobacillus sp. B29 TaxID=3457432 RepID=UPI003FCE159A